MYPRIPPSQNPFSLVGTEVPTNKRGHESDSSESEKPDPKKRTQEPSRHRPFVAQRLTEMAKAANFERQEASGPAGNVGMASSSFRNQHLATIRKAEMTDNKAVNAFIRNLDNDSYEKRFGSLEGGRVHDFLRLNLEENSDADAIFLAFKDKKVVGMADCQDPEDYDPKTVSATNVVVDGKLQGKGIGKDLMATRDAYLQEKGIQYKIERVHANTNQTQIDNLLQLGWKETTAVADVDDDAVEDEDLREFWMALDPRYKDKEPTRLQ